MLEKVVRVPTMAMRNDGLKVPSRCLAIELGALAFHRLRSPHHSRVRRGSEYAPAAWPAEGPCVD